MSAQKTPRRGVLGAIAGLLGFSALAGLLVTVMVAPAIAVTGITASSTIGVFDSLPEYIRIGQQPERNEIYAVGGDGSTNPTLIATIFDQNRQEVPYDQISQFALDAAVDGEDRRFFDHGGVDIASVVRAGIGNFTNKDIESGASTLSMQLVKNITMQKALEEPTEEERKAAYEAAIETSFDRKLREMKLAIGLEKNYTKKEILTAYLNIAFFGANTYGIQAAAQRYYNVPASQLTLAQAASLVAIVQYPGERSLDDPENFEANKGRRDVILDAMLSAGSITKDEYKEALATPVDETTLVPTPAANGCIGANQYARWFCDYVVRSVPDFEFLGSTVQERKDNWKHGGYKLYTTLDLDAQMAAQDATWTFAPNTEERFNLGSATSTVQAGTGRVLVMTENKIFDDSIEGGGPTTSAVNYNTSEGYGSSTGFQPGSTYKLFTLLNWLEQGRGLNERVNGAGRTEDQSKFKDSCGGTGGAPYKFKNAGGETGVWSVFNGTVNSVNGVFVSMGMQVDQCETARIAAALGVERGDGKPLETNPSAILGTNTVTPLSLASAYAAIGANGVWCKPIIVDKAIGPDGSDLGGQTRECNQAIDPEIAAAAAYALRGVVTQGTGSRSYPGDGIPLIGKTGTTDDNNQTWMATATTAWGTAVWVGNSINNYNMFNFEAGGVTGSALRHAITKPTAGALNAKYPGGDFPAPPDRLLGGSAKEVPDVRGMTLEKAKELLTAAGFGFADGGQIDSERPAGQVAATDPPVGTASGLGVVITVYTSKGNQVSFPDVVGDGKTYGFNQAKNALQSQYPNVTEACAVITDPAPGPGPDPRENKVSASNPAPGAFVVPGVPVTLTVTKLACP